MNIWNIYIYIYLKYVLDYIPNPKHNPSQPHLEHAWSVSGNVSNPGVSTGNFGELGYSHDQTKSGFNWSDLVELTSLSNMFRKLIQLNGIYLTKSSSATHWCHQT